MYEVDAWLELGTHQSQGEDVVALFLLPSTSTQFESNVFIINANTHIIIMISLFLNSYCITNLGLQRWRYINMWVWQSVRNKINCIVNKINDDYVNYKSIL